MDTRKLTVGLVSLALLAGAGAWAFAQPGQPPQPAGQAQPKGEEKEGDEEEVITLDKAPEAVRAAAIKLAGDAKNITKVIKEEDDEDNVQYEVEYTEGGGVNAIKCAAIFSAAGDLIETEKATAEAKLPAAVMAALKKDYPKATFANPQAVTRMFYEIEVTIDGKKHEVKVDASGNIEDESQGDDEKGEHGKGEDHEKDEKPEGKKDKKD
ncbi:MAG: hypothetical protein JNM80_00855 [Phycisphaerae bacterium]|nr:hypothetical protein [Phycisphaerae bacterium]